MEIDRHARRQERFLRESICILYLSISRDARNSGHNCCAKSLSRCQSTVNLTLRALHAGRGAQPFSRFPLHFDSSRRGNGSPLQPVQRGRPEDRINRLAFSFFPSAFSSPGSMPRKSAIVLYGSGANAFRIPAFRSPGVAGMDRLHYSTVCTLAKIIIRRPIYVSMCFRRETVKNLVSDKSIV